MEQQGNSIQTAKNTKIAMRVSLISIIVNLLLVLLKLFAGIVSHSQAMLSDAVHSASDVFSTLIVIVGVTLSGRSSDKEHPYGHERMECVASIILAVLLFATGLGIGQNGLQLIWKSSNDTLSIPGHTALFAAVGSILIKEWMYWYTRSAAKQLQSGALMADAWHHRSDALSSVGSFAGILGARLGFPILDPLASVVISLFILKAAIGIFKTSIDQMVDKACNDQLLQEMRTVVLSVPGVIQIDELRTRIFGAMIYVDIEISANGELPLRVSHSIAESVHNTIELQFPQVKHCMVHVNPVSETECRYLLELPFSSDSGSTSTPQKIPSTESKKEKKTSNF